MTTAGWALMLLSCGTVTGVMVFCYWRLLRDDRAATGRGGDRGRRDSGH